MACTYLNNDTSDEKNLICRYKEDETFNFRGVLVSSLSEEQLTEKRISIFNRDKEDIKEFPSSLKEKLNLTKNKDEWKKIYFEYIPFKIDENENFIPELVIPVTYIDIHTLTIDEVRKKYFDIYEHDEDKAELFNKLKKDWNDAKDYVRQMADVIWDNKE